MAGNSLDPEALLEEHGNYLFRYAMVRLRNTEAAEEAIQETLLAALAAREQFQGHASVRSWLVGILKHKITDYFRMKSREFSVSDLASSEDAAEDVFDRHGNWRVEPAAWRDDPVDVLEKQEFWQTFEACMSELPERSAEVFALREFDGLKSKEIGRLLDISPAHLDVLLYRARLRLARCLDAKWFAPERRRVEPW